MRKQAVGFTMVELLAVIAVIALLAVLLIPAMAATRPNAQAFQCQNNERQLTVAWQMYAGDNTDLLPPNDFPYTTAYFTYANKGWMQNWVVGTMESPFDSREWQELVPTSMNLHTNTCLAGYITNAATFRCPADIYIDPFSHTQHVRSYSMNSAVGTQWYSHFISGAVLGSPVSGAYLTGTSYNPDQTTWLTYGKLSAFAKPNPAKTFVFMEDNAYSMNDGAFAASAAATPGATDLIDYAAGNHAGASCVAFVDGHAAVHKWQDVRTFSPQLTVVLPGSAGSSTFTWRISPDDPDCFYLAQITSAAR